MLSEHGLFGLMSLCSILILSFKEYRKRIDYNKVILGVCIFGILTMFHSAFRIASWIYLWPCVCSISTAKMILYIGNILSSKDESSSVNLLEMKFINLLILK